MKGMLLKEFYQFRDNIAIFILTIVFLAVLYSFLMYHFLN